MPTKAELLIKANGLPLCAGVYIMRDRAGKVIYVGKSAKLKNRVSQYFQNSEKNVKTAKMVANVFDFDYILCDTEMEALTLENSLIKQYSPKYNIRLKDSKSYPYIKVTDEEYPRIVFTRTRLSDRAKYFGPFGGAGTVFEIMSLLQKTLGIPSCKLSFPRDIGKGRECLYYQMKQCCGVCRGHVSAEEYGELIKCALDILKGNTRGAISSLEEKMYAYSEAEKYEAAMKCRDTIRALEKIREKQKVVDSPDAEYDVIALYSEELCSCLSIYSVREGILGGKNDYVFGSDKLLDEASLTAFLVDYYSHSDGIPKRIVFDSSVSVEEELLSDFLSDQAGKRVTLWTPQRTEMKKLCAMIFANAKEKANAYVKEYEKDNSTLFRLAEILGLESLPERMEAYDISNIGAEHKTGGMVVYVDGKPKKSDYRTFTIKDVDGTDDYACMRETLRRRLAHLSDERGSMSEYPDLLLIDGGRTHVMAVKEVLADMGLEIPVFGMVKDDFHKTRALCTESEEISIAREQAVYGLIYRVQEEVHRYTVSRMSAAKSKTVKHSSLERINGIGAAKARLLLAKFGSLNAIKSATEEELSLTKSISKADAKNIYNYFHGD
ncbi:MAG: excinuclease ABC subunit UvrC [Clostridia bacterium]|nr:excinuclease ABC subunit UvrC [Clostridia bacterium]